MQQEHNISFFTPLTYNTPSIQIKQIRAIGVFNTITNQNMESSVKLALTDNYLFYFSDLNSCSPSYFCTINFDLKFEIIRDIWLNQQMPGNPVGIKFERQIINKQYEIFEIYSNDIHLLYTWKQLLETKINQRCFHKLFRSKKQIGRGAFASVYLAQRLQDKKLVAVKAFSKQKQFQPLKGKQSLINQINLMRKFNHQNIIHLYGVYQTQNSIYVILQYLQGHHLYHRVKNNEIKDTKDIMEIMKNILQGIKALADKKIIHRDLKPQNILFKKQGRNQLAICDFGLATYADQEKYLFVRCGTPGYVAPQIINIKNVTAKSHPISDVFSVGLIFHYMLQGKSIFEGKKYDEILKQNRACSFNFQKEMYLGVDVLALDLMKKMLDVNPLTRITAQAALAHPFFKKYQRKEVSTQKKNDQMIDEKQDGLNKFMGLKRGIRMVESPSNFNRIVPNNDRRSFVGQQLYFQKENEILQKLMIKKKMIDQRSLENTQRKKKVYSTFEKNGLLLKLRS